MRRIEGYVIVSTDGMIADAKGLMPEAIRNAERDERNHAPGESAQHRTGEKKANSNEQYPLAAIDVGKPSVDRNRYSLCQQIGTENPTEEFKSAERSHDCRHGRRDDRPLDCSHEHRR